jgi:hypothetical protein
MSAHQVIKRAKRIIAVAKETGAARDDRLATEAALREIERLAGELAEIRGDLATIIRSGRRREANENGS